MALLKIPRSLKKLIGGTSSSSEKSSLLSDAKSNLSSIVSTDSESKQYEELMNEFIN